MAYFKGNAINIRGYSNDSGLPINVQIDDCLFLRNQGINVADGAAVNINGDQNHTYKYENLDRNSSQEILGANMTNITVNNQTNLTYLDKAIQIKNSRFIQNTAGQKASCVNIQSVHQSVIEVKNVSFYNNTGSYSFLEQEY